jgi:glycosyltransferase involved in cell wall biosynthesis
VEAMKCGLPVIAANSGGSLELVEDGFNGYLYQSGNAEDLAAKILCLNNNYSSFDSKAISEKAYERFNVTNTTTQLMQVFQ